MMTMSVQNPLLEPSTTTLGGMLRAQAAAHPTLTAIRFAGQSISYEELDRRVDQAAALLLRHGIRHGDRIALMLPNCPEMLIFDLACFRLGAAAVPINTRYQRAEAEYALQHSGAVLLIADARFFPIIDGLHDELPDLRELLIRGAAGNSDLDLDQALAAVQSAGTAAAPIADAAAADDPAVIFYTSGSTARPKGVVHTHQTLLGAARCQVATRRLAPGRRWLVATGIGYVAGLAGVSLPCLYGGATILIEEDLSADSLINAIARERAQASIILPTKLLDILESPLAAERDLSSFEQVYVGGDECSQDLYRRFRARFGRDLAQLLGMTECEGYLTNQPSDGNRPGSIGRPANNVEVRLLGDDGRELGTGMAGEMAVRAPGMMVGYWQNPEATAETLVEGWLHTGDVARRDDEGYYWFVERKREIVIHDGSNIAPHEVENLIDSHPLVAESCVVGVPDPHHGALLKAFVELEPDADPTAIAALSGDVLAAWLETRLSHYKIPTLWELLPRLPRTATGKMDRKTLHARADPMGKPHRRRISCTQDPRAGEPRP
ncbi:MAG: hypothetical protein C1943_05400 [Halochromatium sp.]|nr:hypothetical protein [Halochromatium sp.]